jgi:hypothetical protein
MIRRILALALAAALLAVPAVLLAADTIKYTKVSATSTVTNTTLDSGTQTVLIINDGANEVYFDLYGDAQTPADATTSSKELKSGEQITFEFGGQEFDRGSGSKYYKTLSIICAAAETATVRVFSK